MPHVLQPQHRKSCDQIQLFWHFSLSLSAGDVLANVMASFWEVSVYPTNRDHVLSKLPIQSNNSQRLQEHPSIPMSYVPFCTPRAQPVQTPQPSLPTPECTPTHTLGRAEFPVTPTNNEASVLHMATQYHHLSLANFAPPEVQRFQRRLEEGFDLPDERYSQWLSTLAINVQTPWIHS